MQQLRFYSPQWLYSTCFGRQSQTYNLSEPAYLWPYTAYVLLMMGEIVANGFTLHVSGDNLKLTT